MFDEFSTYTAGPVVLSNNILTLIPTAWLAKFAPRIMNHRLVFECIRYCANVIEMLTSKAIRVIMFFFIIFCFNGYLNNFNDHTNLKKNISK